MLQAQTTVLRLSPVETEIDNLRSAKPEALSSILRRHHGVTKLDLEWVTLQDKDWKILEAMPNLNEIEINRATPEVLGHLSKLPHLRKLALNNSDISYEEMSKVPAMRTVTELTLDCPEILNDKHEFNLKPFPSIRSLSLNGNLLNGALNLRPLEQVSQQLTDLRHILQNNRKPIRAWQAFKTKEVRPGLSQDRR